ncbi:TRAP transporter small permease [Paenalcaligenes hermetiae]|uniref:TRAP transporter small permease protein n=1 Tax=Paenalcaligenes hermetiae TaxID=1157987 RepID=A0ABP9M0Z1_9BURK
MLTLYRFSQRLARTELFVAGSFMAFIFLLLIINIITRLNNIPIYWIDEAAVTAMVWMALLAAAAGIHYRTTIAMTLLKDRLSQSAQYRLDLCVDTLLMLFFAVFLALLIMIFEPYQLIVKHRLDWAAFSSTEFNFVYEEPTMTLGIKKFWTWLILPIFAVSGFIHSLANWCHTMTRLRQEHSHVSN